MKSSAKKTNKPNAVAFSLLPLENQSEKLK
jgi:hypothetical protein